MPDAYCALWNEVEHLSHFSHATVEKLKKAMAESLPDQLTGADQNVRFGAIIILWNAIHHYFPYFDLIDINWREELTKGLTRSLKDNTAKEFQLTMQNFLAVLKDGPEGSEIKLTLLRDKEKLVRQTLKRDKDDSGSMVSVLSRNPGETYHRIHSQGT